jgi:hypothetical protein
MGEDVHRSIATGAKKKLEKRIGQEMIAIDTPRLLNRGRTIARDRLAFGRGFVKRSASLPSLQLALNYPS